MKNIDPEHNNISESQARRGYENGRGYENLCPSNFRNRLCFEFQTNVRSFSGDICWGHDLRYDFLESAGGAVLPRLASEACTANLEEQIGPKATWRRDGTSEIARKLYESDPEYDLVEMVRQRYSDDTSVLGYSYPPPPAESTSL